MNVGTLKSHIQERLGPPPEQQRLVFGSEQMEDSRTLHECGVHHGAAIHLVLVALVGKPVIYLRSPTPIEASVRLSLTHQWRLLAHYPQVPIKRPVQGRFHEQVQWIVRTQQDGSLVESGSGLEVAYLFWEAE